MFKKLKQIGQALSPEAIKQGLAASREAMANGGRLSPEQLAALSPEQRVAYDDAMARMQKTADETIAAEQARRVLLGPAGDFHHGPLPDREQMTTVDIGQQIAYAKDGFKQALRETVRGRPVPAPPQPPVSADPGEQSAYERASRDETRTSRATSSAAPRTPRTPAPRRSQRPTAR